MNIGAFWAIVTSTFKTAIRSKWLIMFTGVFFLFAFNLPLVSLQVIGLLPPNYVAFYIGTLIANTFILMPLLALPLGAVSIVEERESGALGYVLSTRTSRGTFLAGRTVGLLLATSSIIVLGFGLAALVSFHFSSGSLQLIPVTIASILLNATMIGVSLIVSTMSRKRLTAHSMAILIWFVLTYAEVTQNLGAPSAFLAGNQYAGQLPWIYLNPVVMSRLLALMQIPSGIQDIGAAGEAMQYVFGTNAINVLYEWMGVWVLITLAVAFIAFRFQDIR
jgi:Cu-processing system permease protein